MGITCVFSLTFSLSPSAHQWFGNLVTMEWWDDLWLNEGFASFVEYLAVDAIFPEFNIFTQFGKLS